jgi:hypothetical protein
MIGPLLDWVFERVCQAPYVVIYKIIKACWKLVDDASFDGEISENFLRRRVNAIREVRYYRIYGFYLYHLFFMNLHV